MYMKKLEINHLLDPLTRCISPLKSRVIKELRFEHGVDFKELGPQIAHLGFSKIFSLLPPSSSAPNFS